VKTDAPIGRPPEGSRRRKIACSQGGAWITLISTYIAVIPVSGEASGADEQTQCAAPPPSTPVMSAMTAKPGAAA